MNPERWQQASRILEGVLECAADQRAAYLDDVCANDVDLRREVESLLVASERAGSLLDSPAMEMAAPLFVNDSVESMLGQSIGRYRIISALGAGGMGDVYLALDARLGRKIALKLLPTHFITDKERLRRFEQEAHAASTLSHTNVCVIHEVGETENGHHYIAMEFVNGVTLRQHLAGAQLKLSEALDIAIQVASALAAAHTAGIVHRDIKPENIMVRLDGIVKVLDFGLAKLTEQPQTIDSEVAARALVQTDTGMVMGTTAYMSPEQARGLPVDVRTDIWSLGVVLYEMLAGRPPFEGETASDLIAAILKTEPRPFSFFYALEVPGELELVTRKALQKDREARHQTAGDLLNEIKEVKQELEFQAKLERSTRAEAHDRANGARDGQAELRTQVESVHTGGEPPARKTSGSPTTHGHPRWRSKLFIWSASLLLASGSILWLYTYRHKLEPPLPPMKVVPFTSFPGREVHPAFSPDGNQIAFSWSGEKDENLQLYVKQIGSEKSLRITFSTPDWDYSPNWSPDSQRIAFLRFSKGDRAIFIGSSLGAGSERKLLTLAHGCRADRLCWSPDGKFIATPDLNSKQEPASIFLISPESGEKRALTSAPAQSDGDDDPSFSPDSQTVAFVRWYTANTSDLYLVSVMGGEPKRLTFDSMLISGLAWTPEGREIVFSSNRGGTPCLWRISAYGGTPERLAVGADNAGRLSISRSGHRLAYSQGTRNSNIYRIELPVAGGHNNSPMKLIGSTRTQSSPQFSPDGKSIAFSSDRSGSPEIWTCDSAGLNPIQLTSFGGPEAGSPRWSPDGKQLAFDSHAKGDADIYVLSVEGGVPRRITTDSSDDLVPSWSRDGRWIYFSSNRTGTYQVWKVPVDGGEAVQLTKQGGFVTCESADGTLVYYCKGLSVPGLWQVPVEGGEEALVFNLRALDKWAVMNDGIYFIDWVKTDGLLPWEFAIEFFSFATHQITQVTYLGRIAIDRGLTASPDHRSILYAQVAPGDHDIMLVENFR